MYRSVIQSITELCGHDFNELIITKIKITNDTYLKLNSVFAQVCFYSKVFSISFF